MMFSSDTGHYPSLRRAGQAAGGVNAMANPITIQSDTRVQRTGMVLRANCR